MAEPMDRGRWLAAVAAGLEAPPEIEADVLAELAGHLDDEIEGLTTLGFDAGDAERRALAGMGDPRELGRELGRARRTARSALALAGGGALTLVVASMTTFVATLIAFSIVAGLSISIGSLVISTSWPWAPSAYAGFAASIIALTWAGRIATASILARATWPAWTVRAATALGILVVGLPAVLLVPGLGLDVPMALLLPLIPVAGAISALATRREATVSLWPGRRTLAVAVAVLALPAVLWPPVAAPVYPELPPDTSAIARSRDATLDAGIALPESSFGSQAGFDDHVVETIRFDTLAGWHDLVREVWVLRIGPDGAWNLGDGPVDVAPFELAGMTATASIAYVTPRDRPTWILQLDTGIAPDGVRSIFGPEIPDQANPWTGSLLDWIQGR